MAWNRENFSEYYEIYLNVSLELVKIRDPKGIYKKYELGREKNIVGIDVPWHEPEKPNLIINIDKNKSISEITDLITENILLLRNIEIV